MALYAKIRTSNEGDSLRGRRAAAAKDLHIALVVPCARP
jgi:hypothetical protein